LKQQVVLENKSGSITSEDGKTIPLKFAGKYVVPRPNSATISADKMNVVYRGVVNPMSISLQVFLIVMLVLLHKV
jgi:hypothetical protein